MAPAPGETTVVHLVCSKQRTGVAVLQWGPRCAIRVSPMCLCDYAQAVCGLGAHHFSYWEVGWEQIVGKKEKVLVEPAPVRAHEGFEHGHKGPTHRRRHVWQVRIKSLDARPCHQDLHVGRARDRPLRLQLVLEELAYCPDKDSQARARFGSVEPTEHRPMRLELGMSVLQHPERRVRQVTRAARAGCKAADRPQNIQFIKCERLGTHELATFPRNHTRHSLPLPAAPAAGTSPPPPSSSLDVSPSALLSHSSSSSSVELGIS